MEEILPNLVEFDPDSIMLIARSNEKATAQTAFWNCDIEDRAILAWHMISDMIVDTVRLNIDEILGEDDADEDADGT